jgi:DNA-binding transcriptional LysR family regulator
MRFHSVRAFRFVMERGTIAAAAEKLDLSQPAVSRLISGLEAELGVALFLRKGRRLVPTPEGLRLFEETQGILVAIDHLPVIAREIRERVERSVRIVCMPRLAFSVALPVMGTIQTRYPEIRCDLVVLDRVEMEKWIINHDFDVGLAVLPIDTPAVDIKRLGTSPIYVLASNKHALGKRRSIDFSRIIDEPVIALPDGTRDRADMEALFRTHSAKPKIRSVVPTVAAAAALAASGIGITFADRLSISELKHLPIQVIQVDPTWPMAFGLFRPAHRRLTPTISAVISAVEAKLLEIQNQFRKMR